MMDYNTTIHNSCAKVDNFLQSTFKNIFFSGPKFSADLLNTNPAMVVCTHRSHLDYILLGAELHKAGLQNLRFAAADNLTHIPFLGKKFRSLGAFTVYRARSQNRKYIFDLCYDVVKMLDNNEKIIVFPEGGRSYQGNMMQMKNGVIAANIIAQYQSPEKRYCFVPISISYEKLPELTYFNILQKGKKIRKEKHGLLKRFQGNLYYFGADVLAFSKFILAHKFNINYGAVYIDYGDPIFLNDIIDINKYYSPGMRNEFVAHKIAIKKLSDEIKESFQRLYRILPMHVVAAILDKRGSCSKKEAVKHISMVMDIIDKNNQNTKSIHSLAESDLLDIGIEQLYFSKGINVSKNFIEIKYPQFIKYYATTIDF